MGEKRKPKYTILLKKEGNRGSQKVELFESYNFHPRGVGQSYLCRHFRVRVNGKWWPKGERKFVTLTQVKELIFRSSIFKS